MAARARAGGNGHREEVVARMEEQAQLDERYVRTIQELLEVMPNSRGPGYRHSAVPGCSQRMQRSDSQSN